jgi:hypothetical protein
MRAGVGFVLFTLVCLGGAAGYVVMRSVPDDGATSSPREATDVAARLASIRSAPHVYYRSVRAAEFGRVVVAALEAPNDRRVVTDLRCDRLDFGRTVGLCLLDTRGGVGPPARAVLVDAALRTLATFDLAGLPIRVRLSPDERWAAATVFVTGERYESDFTTRTVLIDVAARRVLGDLEQFTTERDGRVFSRVDFNFWGVTFLSGGGFYATLGTGGSRLLVRGDAATRRAVVAKEAVECPSVSPDGTRVAFKKPLGPGAGWRLFAMDVATGLEWPIGGEARSIDDQVEWLDDGHVLYQFAESHGLPEDAMHVWMSPAGEDTTVRPTVFIRAGHSPAVVRP